MQCSAPGTPTSTEVCTVLSEFPYMLPSRVSVWSCGAVECRSALVCVRVFSSRTAAHRVATITEYLHWFIVKPVRSAHKSLLLLLSESVWRSAALSPPYATHRHVACPCERRLVRYVSRSSLAAAAAAAARNLFDSDGVFFSSVVCSFSVLHSISVAVCCPFFEHASDGGADATDSIFSIVVVVYFFFVSN